MKKHNLLNLIYIVSIFVSFSTSNASGLEVPPSPDPISQKERDVYIKIQKMVGSSDNPVVDEDIIKMFSGDAESRRGAELFIRKRKYESYIKEMAKKGKLVLPSDTIEYMTDGSYKKKLVSFFAEKYKKGIPVFPMSFASRWEYIESPDEVWAWAMVEDEPLSVKCVEKIKMVLPKIKDTSIRFQLALLLYINKDRVGHSTLLELSRKGDVKSLAILAAKGELESPDNASILYNNGKKNKSSASIISLGMSRRDYSDKLVFSGFKNNKFFPFGELCIRAILQSSSNLNADQISYIKKRLNEAKEDGDWKQALFCSACILKSSNGKNSSIIEDDFIRVFNNPLKNQGETYFSIRLACFSKKLTSILAKSVNKSAVGEDKLSDFIYDSDRCFIAAAHSVINGGGGGLICDRMIEEIKNRKKLNINQFDGSFKLLAYQSCVDDSSRKHLTDVIGREEFNRCELSSRISLIPVDLLSDNCRYWWCSDLSDPYGVFFEFNNEK